MNWVQPQKNRIAGHFIRLTNDIKVNELFDGLKITGGQQNDNTQDMLSRILKKGTIGVVFSDNELYFFEKLSDAIVAYTKGFEKEKKTLVLSAVEMSNMIQTVRKTDQVTTKMSNRVLSNIEVLE